MSALGPLASCPGCRDVPSVAWRLLDCGEGCPPAACVGLGSGAGSLGRVSVACGPLGSGLAADPGREAADELDRLKRCLPLALGRRENGGDVRPFGAERLGPASGVGGR